MITIDKPLDLDLEGSERIREDEEAKRFELMTEALVEILSYFVSGNPKRAGHDPTVGKRVVTAVWAINLEYFEEVSLADLAKTKGIGTTTAWLSRLAVQFSDRYGIKNLGTHSDRVGLSYRDASKTFLNGHRNRDKISQRPS